MSGSAAVTGHFFSANIGHVFSVAATIALTALALYPIVHFMVRGWAIKKDDIFSSFSEQAKILYLKTFLKLNLADGAAAKTFNEIYGKRYGRGKFVGPAILFAVVCFAAMFLLCESGVSDIWAFAACTAKTKLACPNGALPFLIIPAVPAAGISGAYLWLVADLISKARRLDLAPADILGSALRLAMAAALSYAITGMGGDKSLVASALAFALGAFPLDAVRIIIRRIATKNFGLQVGIDDTSTDQIIKINGIDHPAADRLMDADISTIAQLAYCDPVQLCMRTGFLFDFIVDVVSQALAWNYFEEKLDKLRSAGLRGAMEINDVLTDLRNLDEPDAAGRAARIMDEAAEIAGLSPLTFYNACDEVAGDPYTVFLCNTWRADA